MPPSDDDFLELPAAAGDAVGGGQLQQRQQRGLTEHQTDRAVEAGAQIAEGAMECAKTILRIHEIREQSAGDVAKVQAETDRLREQLRGDVDRMRERRATLRDKGSVTVDIIRATHMLLRDIPEDDRGARVKLLEGLPEFIQATLGSGSTGG